MDHLGIDVHKKESQMCILAGGGELIEQRTRTESQRLAEVLDDRPRARIVIEARQLSPPTTPPRRTRSPKPSSSWPALLDIMTSKRRG